MTEFNVLEVAKKVWETVLDDNQKAGIRLGLFPAEIMEKYNTFAGSQFAVALMAVAAQDGGMKV